MGADQDKDEGMWREIDLGNPLFFTRSFSAELGGPAKKRSGGPEKRAQASANLE